MVRVAFPVICFSQTHMISFGVRENEKKVEWLEI
jgi:hypothetical protein